VQTCSPAIAFDLTKLHAQVGCRRLGLDLADLAREAASGGWATGAGSLVDLQLSATRLGWRPVENRSGDKGSTRLTPTASEDATAPSMSAAYGLDEQPLHTDGAHLRQPPRWLVFHSSEGNLTPTLLWSLLSPLSNPKHPVVMIPSFVSCGVFLTSGGDERFLCLAYNPELGWRYDPLCMWPSDERARRAVEYLGSLRESAFEYHWTTANQVLLIKNSACLHARASAAHDEARSLTRLSYSSPT
jgi:hypothetical protein